MHELLERGLASEVRGPQCISYILEDESLFNLSEYKIIHNQGSEKFLDSTRSVFNGKTKLTYFLDEYASLKSIAAAMEVYPFITVISNVMSGILEVSRNAYLDMSDLILELSRIYVNPSTLEVKLIYLPVNTLFDNGASLLNSAADRLRSDIVKLIISTPGLMSARTKEICNWLSDSSMSLDDICTAMRLEKHEHISGGGVAVPKTQILMIRGINPHDRTMIEIRKTDNSSFIIGRNAADVDGCIPGNPAISGKHCIVYKTKSGYEIEDTSTNGTFVNGIRLAHGKRTKLSNGDTLRLANSSFSVSITEG